MIDPKKVLEQNTTGQGIVAGATHFHDLWARDALYASWGAIEVGALDGVRKTLETLYAHQNPMGQIPLRVGRTQIVRALLGMKSNIGAVYGNDKSSSPAPDCTALYVITLGKLAQKKSVPFVKRAYGKSIAQAMNWLATQDTNQDCLLEEKPYASWDDALRKRGASLYTNVLYYAALVFAGKILQDPYYATRAKKIKQGIIDTLWSENFFIAWKGKQVFDVPGNLLAIYFGIASKEQTERILTCLDEKKKAAGHVIAKTNYGTYGFFDVYFPFYFVGMADYHNNGPFWSWVGALEALVLAKNKRRKDAADVLRALQDWFSESGSIYEIYDKPRKPAKRLFYTSEKDFSWTAGLFLLAQKKLTKDRP